MTLTRMLVGALAAAMLGAPAALAQPADIHAPLAHAAAEADASHGTTRPDTAGNPNVSADHSAKANVYVPPANAAAHRGHSATATVYVPPANAVAGDGHSAKANVYVPPANAAAAPDQSATSSSSWDLDWGSAAIGAAAALGAFLLALAGAAALRHRRQFQPSATS